VLVAEYQTSTALQATDVGECLQTIHTTDRQLLEYKGQSARCIDQRLQLLSRTLDFGVCHKMKCHFAKDGSMTLHMLIGDAEVPCPSGAMVPFHYFSFSSAPLCCARALIVAQALQATQPKPPSELR